MTPWLVDFPQAREAPDAVRRALRALDPTAEVVYLGPRHWLVGRVRPNRHVRKIAEDMLTTAASVLSTRAANAPSRRARVALALLGLQGFRPVQEYRLNDLDGRVVLDFAASQYRMQHTSDAETARALEAEPDRPRLLGDLDLGREAHRTAFTSSFGAAVSSVQSSRTIPLPSTRTRHVIPQSA